MTGFMPKLAKSLAQNLRWVQDNFPQKKHINRAEVFFQPFAELRQQLVSWIEESRETFTLRQDFNPEMLGFDHFDAGGYAEVYTSPCKRFAIRVSRDCADSAYQDFLTIALQRQHNPFYPKVYALLQHENRQVVLMEYLTLIDLDDPEYDEVEILREDSRLGKTGSPCPNRQELVRDIHALVAGDDCRLDLHPDNALLRHTGTGRQLVVTDPIAG